MAGVANPPAVVSPKTFFRFPNAPPQSHRRWSNSGVQGRVLNKACLLRRMSRQLWIPRAGWSIISRIFAPETVSLTFSKFEMIQEVSDKIEITKPAPQMVLNNQ
jgi:hypothetical protein